jgi:two-component system sensor histidine kinase YesM
LNHYQNQVVADNLRVKSILFEVTTSVYNISDEIFIDKDLQKLLATRYNSKQVADKSCSNYTKLKNYINRNTYISSIKIYTNNPTIYKYDSIIQYASIIPVTKEIEKNDWYQQAINHADITWKSLNSIDYWKHISQELSLIRRIPIISTKEYAVLKITISNNYLKNRVQNNSLFNTVSVNRDPVFFSTQRNLSGEYLTLPIDYDKSQYQYSGELSYENKKSIANISTLLPYASKDRIYISTLDFNAFPDVNHIILLCAATVLLASALPFLIINQFTNKLSTRIITLRREMHKVSKGNYNIIDNIMGEDELSEVYSDLKVMIQSIQQMDANMYEAKIQEQDLKNQQQKMEFKMLASQINPHFLYNTLETIRMKALTEGNKEVANVIKLLGKSMHYVLENTGTSSTTLKKELDYISIYLNIQKLIFRDRVNYKINAHENKKL